MDKNKRIKKLQTFADSKELALQSEMMDANDSLDSIRDTVKGVHDELKRGNEPRVQKVEVMNHMDKEVQKVEVVNRPEPREVQKIEFVNKDAELAAAFFSLLKGPQGQIGPAGPQGIQGPEGKKGKDGKSVRGPAGKDGKEGPIGPAGKDGKDGSPDTAEQIVEKINSLPDDSEFKIDAKQIRNLPKPITNIVGGGSTTVKAGTNVSVTRDWTGAYVVSSSAGSSLTFVESETPSGTVNGSNTDFALTNTPVSGSLRVYINRARMIKTTDYTLSGTTITFTTAPETGDIIRVDYAY